MVASTQNLLAFLGAGQNLEHNWRKDCEIAVFKLDICIAQVSLYLSRKANPTRLYPLIALCKSVTD